MKRRLLLAVVLLLSALGLRAQTRQWTVSDGLPTNEVRQIVELPNGQMLVGCEGLYCLTVGETFVPIAYDRTQAVSLTHFATRYGHLWQGDSLLWLHDLYRIYLFDARTRSFRTDAAERMNAPGIKDFAAGKSGIDQISDALWPVIDKLGLRNKCMTVTKDRQGGLWIGTWENGVIYKSPRRMMPQTMHNDSLMWLARGAYGSKRQMPQLPYRRLNFTCDLPDGRILIGHDMNRLDYYLAEKDEIQPIDLPQLSGYRNIVGVCPIDRQWTLLYSQNGITLFNTVADTLAPFPADRTIKPYTDKYNCVIRDRKGNIWAGTQNGLFVVTPSYSCRRIEGLANQCIRSLVFDAEGHVWAGTSCGISRITPAVVNYTADDGIPPVSMMERAACLTRDGRLVFVHGTQCTAFRPEWLSDLAMPLPVQLLSVSINGMNHTFVNGTDISLSYDENYLTLQFSTLDYAHTNPSRYRYRLSPLEKEWNEGTSYHGFTTAAYTALPHGRYVFEMQAATADGGWTSVTCQTFVIHPPLWLTWWAKTIYAIIALTILIVLVTLYLKWKRRQLERENDERVNRLFEQRAEARHQFAENTHINPQKIGVNSEEEAFMAQLLKVIETHLSDSEYGVDQMAQDVAMSRSKLYDKMRNMLGISPADFIRNVRLKRSAELLTGTSLPITDIAERVGFATARNYSQQFKKMFGVLPSEYRSQGQTL